VVRGTWVYAVLQETGDQAGVQETHVAWGDSGPLPAAEVAGAIPARRDGSSPYEVPDPFGTGKVRVFVAALALDGAAARLAFASREPDFPREDQQLLMNVAVNQGAIALQAARLLAARERAERALRQSHVRLEEESRTVEMLRQVGLALTAELELDALLQRVTDAATGLSGAQFGAFFYNVVKDQGESYMLYTISGVPREQFSGFDMPRNTAVFEPTFRGVAVVRSDDITRDPRYGHNSPHFRMPKGHLPVRSYLAHPVVGRSGEVLGGLFFGHSEAGVFGDREEQLVAGIAAHAAIALENARLYEAERGSRAEAEAAVRARDEFLGIASHELRNPLAGLKAAVQLLVRSRARGHAEPERLDRFLGEISRAADRLADLLEDLLDVSRLRTGRFQIRPELTDLAELVRETAETYRRETPERDIEVASRAADYKVVLDRERIQQVVANLLSNALKYSPDGGPVHIDLADGADDGVLLRVRDTGIGLPAATADSIFEPFGRAPNAHSRNIPGMGLGLYICRQIVLSHAGRIWAESEGEGRGTTLTVWLPRSNVENA